MRSEDHNICSSDDEFVLQGSSILETNTNLMQIHHNEMKNRVCISCNWGMFTFFA